MRNTDPTGRWNDPAHRDDPMEPWNDPVYRDDPCTPWNNPAADNMDYNRWKEDHCRY